METERKHGPFTFVNDCIRTINCTPSRQWRMLYGSQELAMRTITGQNLELSVLFEAFEQDRSRFISEAQKSAGLMQVNLVDSETDGVISSFMSFDMCGMTPGLINDSSHYWLQSDDGKYSSNILLSDWAHIVEAHEAPELGWVTALLPDDVLTSNAEEWRAPTSWELRHVVGEGSFTGISGAKAAEMVGVTPQNFRKYTAQDGAATRQKISFAMWHLLLHKLRVQKA